MTVSLYNCGHCGRPQLDDDDIQVYAQPEQEPVACVGPWHDARLTLIPRYSYQTFKINQPLYTAAQRPWQGLTDDDWGWVADKKGTSLDTFDQGAAWAQQRLMERNK